MIFISLNVLAINGETEDDIPVVADVQLLDESIYTDHDILRFLYLGDSSDAKRRKRSIAEKNEASPSQMISGEKNKEKTRTLDDNVEKTNEKNVGANVNGDMETAELVFRPFFGYRSRFGYRRPFGFRRPFPVFYG